MILVAVGTQLPFDRLVRTVDDWAKVEDRPDVVAQIGPSGYVPQALKSSAMIPPEDFARLQREADLIVAHAGMGSILGALEVGTPIIVMPREHARGEHRNDHQRATARRFADVTGVHVAEDEVALRALLDRAHELQRSDVAISGTASETLVKRLRDFVFAEPAPRSARRRLSVGRLLGSGRNV